MAYLARDGGRGLRTVIWSRVEAMLQRVDPTTVMRAVVDGDITGPTTDQLTIVMSEDFDPGLIGSVLPREDALLLGVLSVSASAVCSYDGAHTYIELVADLVPRVSGLCTPFLIC